MILIDHLNGVEKATAYLRQVREKGRVSAITRAEVLAGIDTAKAGPVRMLLDAFPLVVIDGPVADLAADLRRRYRLRLPDAFQAAAATRHGLKLAPGTRRTSRPDASTSWSCRTGSEGESSPAAVSHGASATRPDRPTVLQIE